eukprot:TRINITY_DN5286_c0_g1_i1.p1 TRINITY_DN5286_c0_g1~~TRINITY_DN5286_c0_g1_i1.p1  ORF type:complete len:54 (+),score=11.08 TRINITY_DN5286_c0_g1_i1:187-348(+)
MFYNCFCIKLEWKLLLTGNFEKHEKEFLGCHKNCLELYQHFEENWDIQQFKYK